MGLQFFSVTNVLQFNQLMYRSLFSFGNGSRPTLNLSPSLARGRCTSKNGDEVTITMKPCGSRTASR